MYFPPRREWVLTWFPVAVEILKLFLWKGNTNIIQTTMDSRLTDYTSATNPHVPRFNIVCTSSNRTRLNILFRCEIISTSCQRQKELNLLGGGVSFSFLVPLPLSLCVESTSYVPNAVFLPCDHGLDFFYISLCENSLDQSKWLRSLCSSVSSRDDHNIYFLLLQYQKKKKVSI